MEDSACDADESPDHESIWVWIKPAAFYNLLETRYKANRYLLRRSLSYARVAPKPAKKNGSQLQLKFWDLVKLEQGPMRSSISLKLSVYVIVCEQISEREFNPFFVNLVHLKASETLSVDFNLEELDSQFLTVLLIVRSGLPDLSILHKDKTMALSTDLTKKSCFGCIPIGTDVWWYAHALRFSSPKLRVHRWETGCITLGEKSIWNGFQNRQFKMLSLEKCKEELPETEAPPSFCINKLVKRNSSFMKANTASSTTTKEEEVAFRFMFGTVHPQCVEQRTVNFGCPFCSMRCKDLFGLKCHLRASHDLFIYDVETRDMTLIWVKRRMDVFDANGDIFCPNTKRLIEPVEKDFYLNRAAFLNPKPVTKKRKTDALHQEGNSKEKSRSVTGSRKRLTQQPRQVTRGSTRPVATRRSVRLGTSDLSEKGWRFCHSRTAAPMTMDELKNGPDTDDEHNSIMWEIKTRRELSQIPGASKPAVEFMFRWDKFLQDYVWPYADYKIPMACKLFAIKMQQAGLTEIANHQHFLHHLHALYMFKLIQQEDVDSCIKIFRSKFQSDQVFKEIPILESELNNKIKMTGENS